MSTTVRTTNEHVRRVVSVVRREGSSRWVFFSLCAYVASQSFTIPVLPVGPGWAVWPNLSDLAVVALVMTALLCRRGLEPASRASQRVLTFLFLILVGWIASWLVHLMFRTDNLSTSLFWVGFYIYRFVEFAAVFVVVSRIPLTPYRRMILARVTAVTLTIVFVGVVLTFFDARLLGLFVSHLPHDPSVAGPWSMFYFSSQAGNGNGWGTIGYNHGYVALQILILTALYLHLRGRGASGVSIVAPLMGIVAVFLTESRAGLAAMILLVLAMIFRRPVYVLVVGLLAAGVLLVQPTIISPANTSSADAAIEHQQALLDPTSTENLNGRTEIWREHLAFLSDTPFRWIFGAGLGSTVDGTNPVRNQAHMLYLQIVLESGVLGLVFFGIVAGSIVPFLFRYDSVDKPIFWCTIGLLVTAVSQETFYPVPAFGHFLGLYLCTVAIVLRAPFKGFLDGAP